jgi:hypothetical protein
MNFTRIGFIPYKERDGSRPKDRGLSGYGYMPTRPKYSALRCIYG